MPQSWIVTTLRNWGWGLFVGLLGLIASGYFAFAQYRSIQQLDDERLKQALYTFSESIDHRIDAYTEIAFGLRSLFVVNPATNRKAFEEAVVRLDVEKRYPGIKNIAFTRYVPASQKQAFESSVRSDTSLNPAGYPEFSIRPPGERPEYFVADYLWPQSGSIGVHGLDISAQPANLASMRYAIATGLPTASAPFELIQETTDKTGFVVRVPVFADLPDKTFLGSVAVTLRVRDLLAALRSQGTLQGLHVALTDVGSTIPDAPTAKPVPLFSYQEPVEQGAHVQSQMLEVYGRQWMLEAHAATSYLSSSERQLPLWIGLSGAAISVLIGVLTGLLGQGRRNALDKLAATNAVLQSVLDHVPIRVFWKDRDCRYLGCNQLFAKDAGRGSSAEVVGRFDDEMGWATQAASYQQDDRSIMESGHERLRFVEPQTTPDGRTIWLETSKVPLRNALGEVVGILGVYDDITERRINDDELAQYRSNLESMVAERTTKLEAANRQLRDTQFAMDSVGIGIYRIDIASATVLDVNRFAAELLGYSVEQMHGMVLTEVVPTISDGVFRALVDRVRRESFIHREFDAQKADGSLVPVDLIAYYQRQTDGSPESITAFVTDVTERKAAERELLRATEAAEAANLAKSAFLANMSHEIRTPLNAITGMTYLIRRSGVTAEQNERLKKIDMAGDHLLEILNSILDLSKIEAGKFALEEIQLDIGAIVSNVSSILQHQAQAKMLSIVIDNQLTDNSYCGDPTRLQQGLLNFGTNAIKFSDQGQVTIRVRAVESDSVSALIHFEVEDQGIGVDSTTLGRLFSAFEQADNSTTRRHGGTGLGLAITKKLAQLMGGDAGASSELGQGSRFWFTARLRHGTYSGIREIPTPGLPAETILARDYSDRRILLVEDDEFNQEIALILLNEIWPTVELAEDGQDAVERMKTERFDLILMDVQMPRLDGMDASRQIRALPHGVEVPIIALTANAFIEDRNRCFAAGMNDFLSKPVKPVELYEVILKWIRQ
jgi:PAS domain S-box-containing protein